MLIDLLLFFALALVLFWAVAAFYLQGEDLSAYDVPTGERFPAGLGPGTEMQAVNDSLSGFAAALRGVPRSQHKVVLRRYMDELFADRPLAVSTTTVDAAGVPAQWVLVPGGDTRRRTLYIHGGAFFAGSTRSHRTLTSRFAELTGGAVLAIDYRLMPEHPRRAGIEDCRSAYQWMLENGPDAATPAATVFVAGDSAGGNLTLSLIAWLRDQGLRTPDAAVVLSPATDATLASPSLKANIRSDAMLGPMFGALAKVPRSLLLWGGWIQNRINPRDPLVSPVYGDLSKLPPVLVHAGEQEMLYDDSRRYVNRARAAGSPVQLQSWGHGLHAWHIFNPELPEARAAFDEIGKFLETATATATARPASAAPGPRSSGGADTPDPGP